MTDRPILFSAPMVRALLAGRKRQTRRILKLQPIQFAIDDAGTLCDVGCLHAEGERLPRITLGRVVTLQELPYAIGDQLWVRESWRTLQKVDCLKPCHLADDRSKVTYEADPENRNPLWAFGKLRPSLFMPRWASRLTLLVTDVRVERLQNISRDDAMAEGIVQTWGDFGGSPPAWALREGEDESHFYDNRTSVENFRLLWESINGPDAWTANPWVVAVSFTAVASNIDDLPVPALPDTDALGTGHSPSSPQTQGIAR